MTQLVLVSVLPSLYETEVSLTLPGQGWFPFCTGRRPWTAAHPHPSAGPGGPEPEWSPAGVHCSSTTAWSVQQGLRARPRVHTESHACWPSWSVLWDQPVNNKKTNWRKKIVTVGRRSRQLGFCLGSHGHYLIKVYNTLGSLLQRWTILQTIKSRNGFLDACSVLPP